jgi:hypothetical protein
MPKPAFRYHAFVSCHRDNNRQAGRQWATWLEQEIESFAVPAHLRGRRTPFGPIPARLSPIFQHADAPATSTALSPKVREALELSRALVVICSPEAAQSREIAEEIRYFKQLGRDRVLAFIIAGEPDAADAGKARLGIGPEDECFPETLRHDVRRDGTVDKEWVVHPVSVDARLEGAAQGYTTPAALRDALVKDGVPASETRKQVAPYAEKLEQARGKIFAALLGVPPEELVPPEAAAGAAAAATAARAHPGRWGRRFAMVLVLLLLGAGGWFVWHANEQRQAAEDARRRSDMLILWLQRDLREKLTATNQLTLLAEANERITTHLTALAKKAEEPAVVSALADALGDGADIASARTAFATAVELASQAVQTRERALAVSGKSSEGDVRLVADHRRLAQALLGAGRKQEAVNEADAARKMASALARRDEGGTEVIEQLAGVSYELGEMQLELARQEEAVRSFEDGYAAAQRLATTEPANARFQRQVARGEARLGDLQLRRGNFNAAIARYRAWEKILTPLAAAEPGNTALQGELAEGHAALGNAFGQTQNFAEAAVQQRQALEITEQLAKLDATNPARQLDFANACRRLAESLLKAGPAQKTEALTWVQRALEHLDRQFPDKANIRANTLRKDLERVREAVAPPEAPAPPTPAPKPPPTTTPEPAPAVPPIVPREPPAVVPPVVPGTSPLPPSPAPPNTPPPVRPPIVRPRR